MARQLGVERVLIVCPTSLKHQWEREIARFTERRALVVGGLRVRREQLYAAQDGFFRITNYDSVHADLDLIGKWSPDLVILDEAQRIKNWNTRIARSVKRIASPYAIVLTGTPLENRLEELVSIVEFVDKHRLGPTFRFLAAHQMRDENGKVVVFSQWVRMLELLVRRLKGKRVDHVLFHGGVEGTRRKALVDRFREDDRCRVFLSTDAGGVGLNLQQASTVVNMDLPWNPAVMEQRIGRVHRLGQQNPVRVINFIAEGTIEDGMLSVLKFKKSLFAGVLDGGEREVFLGGSRLSRFMETVEHATASAQQPNIAGDRVRASKSHVATERRVGATSPAAVAGDWAALMQSGLAWFEQFATVARAAGDGRADGLRVIHRDPQTGQDYLKIPVPSPEVLDRALQTIGSLLNRFRP
jgi:SNF2 family DNA or RNA helicase